MNTSIYDTLKERIIFFDYEPGEMLNEKHMATEFGVSRTPIREVLLRLEWEKLVSIMPRAGIMVSKIDIPKLHEVFQTRAPLEGLLGRIAAAKLNNFHFSKLEEVREECEDILVNRSRTALIKVDINFREILHDAVNKEFLRETSNLLYYQTQKLWHLIFAEMDFNLLLEDEIEYIRRSIAIFRERDQDKAEAYRKQAIFTDLNRVRNIFEFSQDTFATNRTFL